MHYWGLAAIRWGEPRFTRDVDLTVVTTASNEEKVIDQLLTSPYRSRIAEGGDFARRNGVLLLQANNGIPLDVVLGRLPFERDMAARSSLFECAPGCELRTCSAEDLAVQKLFAFRERDRLDVRSLAVRQRDNLDWAAVEANLRPLVELKEQPEIMEFFRHLRDSGG